MRERRTQAALCKIKRIRQTKVNSKLKCAKTGLKWEHADMETNASSLMAIKSSMTRKYL
jgi:hypothetical protein